MRKISAAVFLWLSYTAISMAQVSSGGGQVSSGGQQQGQITLQNPLGDKGFADVVASILAAIYTLSIPIVSIMIMVGGYYILTSGGDEEKLRKGRHAITYAVIGFVVILLANGIAMAVKQALGI